MRELLVMVPPCCVALGILIGTTDRPAPSNSYRYYYQSLDDGGKSLTITNKGRPIFGKHYDREREARKLVDLAKTMAAQQCWGLTCMNVDFRTIVPQDGVMLCRFCWWPADPPPTRTEQAL